MSEQAIAVRGADVVAMPQRTADVVRMDDFMPVFTVQKAVERKQMINAFIGEVLKEGIDGDYSKIPGASDKKVLLKPGAEKLCSIFGLAPQYIKETVIEDWMGVDHGSEPLFYYEYRCRLFRGDRCMGEALGSCNSWESKHRYRWVAEEIAKPRADFAMLPKRGGQKNLFEPDFALDKKQTDGQYGKPAEYWAQFERAIQSGTARRVTGKKMGKKTFDGYEIQVDTTLYRIPNPEIADTINACQKVGQKRALVAAVLVVTNCSDAFTQDLEDNAEYSGRSYNPDPHPAPPEDTAPPPQRQPNAAPITGRAIPEQLVGTVAEMLKSDTAVKPAFSVMEKALASKGDKGKAEYERVINEFAVSVDKKKRTRGHYVEVLMDMWEAYEALNAPAEAEPVEPEFIAEDSDVGF